MGLSVKLGLVSDYWYFASAWWGNIFLWVGGGCRVGRWVARGRWFWVSSVGLSVWSCALAWVWMCSVISCGLV